MNSRNDILNSTASKERNNSPLRGAEFPLELPVQTEESHNTNSAHPSIASSVQPPQFGKASNITAYSVGKNTATKMGLPEGVAKVEGIIAVGKNTKSWLQRLKKK